MVLKMAIKAAMPTTLVLDANSVGVVIWLPFSVDVVFPEVVSLGCSQQNYYIQVEYLAFFLYYQ